MLRSHRPDVLSGGHTALGQIGTPSESTRGERQAPSRADLEAWRAKMRGKQMFPDTV